ncbi:CLUMA_CG006740, isoform A [Clunio marinus]|uniref:CLUMA_CG006740, isoform A n=1 Tax=Clunio marinus TaxID=568069 RepID=A0A1J1I0T7_9DIPT|nr:CLUMA_CG006740, isoform A [Clunio marinus]
MITQPSKQALFFLFMMETEIDEGTIKMGSNMKVNLCAQIEIFPSGKTYCYQNLFIVKGFFFHYYQQKKIVELKS